MRSPMPYSVRRLSREIITRSVFIKLGLAVVLAGLSSIVLIRPVIGSAAPVMLDLTVSISDAAPVVEGNPTPTPSVTPSPTPVSTFVVSLSTSNPGPDPVTVNYQTQDGTANGQDYQSTSGQLSFDIGEQTKTIVVPITPDTLGEGDEDFFVNLSNPQGNGATLGTDQGKGVIIDDDPGGVMQFSQANYTVDEETDNFATITVNRTLDLLGTVTVSFETQDSSAQKGKDYGHTAGTLIFGPGETTKTFQVPILHDSRTETNRSFNVNLSNATNGATVGSQSSATVTIIDNDPVTDIFAISVTNKLLKFHSDAPNTVTVIGAVSGLQAGEQVVAIDLRPANSQLYALGKTGGVGRLYTINPATAAATLVAALAADPSDSTSPYTTLDGSFFDIDFDPVADQLRVVSDNRQNLRVNPANGQVITDSKLTYGGSDQNFGANPNITAAAYTNIVAGNSSTTLYDIDSNLSTLVKQDPPNNGVLATVTNPLSAVAPITSPVSLDFRGGDNAAFVSLTKPGDVTSKLYLMTFNNYNCGPDCGYNFALVDTIGGGDLIRSIATTPAPVSAVLTVSISDAASVVEGNPTPTPSPSPSPSPSVSPSPTPTPSPASFFTVSLSAANPGPDPVTVDYQTQDGTADTFDYKYTSGTLSFAQGEQTKTIVVPIIPDTVAEGDENFFVKLSNPQGVTIGNNQGKGIIIDDDTGGVMQFSQATYTVNEDTDNSVTITVNRTLYLAGTVSINFNTSDGTAIKGVDYANTAGTLIFAAGETTKTFQVPILHNSSSPSNKSFSVHLTSPTNGATTASPADATIMIVDNDAASDVFAVSLTNKLLKFRSNTPNTVTVVGTISGLQTGEQIVGIDFRPTIGQLYALGNKAGAGRLYTINTATAAATLVAALAADPSDSTSPYTALDGSFFDIDFDPVADQLRIVSDTRQNLHVNPANGQVVTDGKLAYGGSDTNFGANPSIAGAAYSNSVAGATSTTLYDIDANFNSMVKQDPANNGLLNTISTINGLGLITAPASLDIRGDNALLFSLTPPGDTTSKLFLITISPNCSTCINAGLVGGIGGGEAVRAIAAAPAGTFQFSAATATVNEGAGKVSLTVTRTGDTTGTASIECDTADGTATQKGDYTIARNRLTFGPGEVSKTCDISITDDALPEPDETFTVSLVNATGNFSPGIINTVLVTIKDNDAVMGTNPIDSSAFFVRQHYLDFLAREPDTSGLNFWVTNIESCGADQNCREAKRIDTSAAFFLSIEFQETGFYVLRLQRAAFDKESSDPGSRMVYSDFIRDQRQVASGVIIGQPTALTLLDQNKTAYAMQVVSSPQFKQNHSSNQSAVDYVNDLFDNLGPPTAAERQAAIDAFGVGDLAGRAAALRSVTESNTARQAELNPAFVLMEYFGYLRRTPTDPPDNNNNGYSFWLNKLNTFNGDFHQAEMVKAFLESDEYRTRFGQ
jgi:xanthosine utilization system XapX-like protein